MKVMNVLKRICSAIVTAAMCLSLAACVPGRVETEEEQGKSSTITVAVRAGEERMMRDVITAFEQENPDIKVKLTEIGTDFQQYRLVTAAFSSEEYLFDVVEIEDVWVDDFADKQYITPLSGVEINEGCFPAVRSSFQKDGELYAIPFRMDIGMIFSLKSHGWDGEMASLVKDGGTDAENLNSVDSDSEEMICRLIELMTYTGDDTGRALQLYRDIYYKSENDKPIIESFKSKDIPVMREWASAFPQLRGDSSDVVGEFDAYNMAQNGNGEEISTAKLYGFAISSLSDKKEICQRFLEYFSRDDVQTELVRKTGTYPLKAELYDLPAIDSVWGHIRPMKDRIAGVQFRPRMRKYMDRADALQKSLVDYMEGRLPLDEAEKTVRAFFED